MRITQPQHGQSRRPYGRDHDQECFLDVLCVKYSGKSAGLTIYEDSLHTNIIGEFSLKEFLNENQVRSPVVRTEYAEVQEINRVSYRSLHSTTKIGKKWIPVTARVIPGVALPLLVGINFSDGHAECPTMQRQVNDLNAPRIFFFRDSKAPISNITLKHLNRIHRDMDHPDHTQMATECIKLGHKVSKAVELCEEVINDTHLFSLEYMDTGYTIAKFESRYEMLNMLSSIELCA